MTPEELVESFIEVKLPDADAFLKIRETLTRIGVSSRKEKKLFQSVHILHKRGKYYLVHFKELFRLDGKHSTLSESDIARRNTIVNLISQWGLCELLDPSKSENPVAPLSQIKIVSFKEKDEYLLVPKYSIGKKAA